MKVAKQFLATPAAATNAEVSWMDNIKAHNATYFTAEMVQRTSQPDAAAESVWASDHFALERMARGLRQDYFAHLVYAGQLWIVGRLSIAVLALAPIGRSIGRRLHAAAARAARWQRERRDAYLAEATDVYDIERRMRDLERRHQRSFR